MFGVQVKGILRKHHMFLQLSNKFWIDRVTRGFYLAFDFYQNCVDNASYLSNILAGSKLNQYKK